MAKKKSAKKPANEKKSLKKHVEHHLSKKVSVPVVAVIVLLLLMVIRVPYEATETYTVEVEEEYEEVILDKENPREEEVCEDVPSNYELLDHETFGRIEGRSDYFCIGSFRVMNHEQTEGKWIYSYVFTVNGKEFPIVEEEETIQGLSQVTFTFESDVCKEGDTIEGGKLSKSKMPDNIANP